MRRRRAATGRGLRAAVVALVALAGLVLGCGRPATERGAGRSWTIHEHRHVSDEDSSEVYLRYAVWSSPAAPQVADSLNAWTRALLLRAFDGDTVLGDTTAVLERFLTASARTHGEFPDMPPWYLEREIEPVADTLGVISLSFRETSYAGGAHPNTLARFTNFDARTGRAFGLEDAFHPGTKRSVDAAAEVEFRRSLDLAPNADLGAAGFWFDENRFQAPENFAVEGHGLRFHFNPYEIAPYAMGPIEFFVPWEALREFLRPDGPLGQAARPPA